MYKDLYKNIFKVLDLHDKAILTMLTLKCNLSWIVDIAGILVTYILLSSFSKVSFIYL